MASGNLLPNWSFKRKLPEPFEDYTDDPVFKNVYSKHCIGKFTAGCYQMPPDPESNPEKYMLKEDDKSGAALIFALIQTAMADDELNEHYQKLKEDRDNGYPNMDETAETAAILCDNLYRRIRSGTSLTVGGIPNDTPANGSIPQLKAFTVQKGTYSPTDVILGTFQVVKPGTSTRKVMASVSKNDFAGKYILSESRTLTPQEELTVPQIPDWYIIPPEIKRICEHAKLTTATVSPMRNFLLRGPAGTGKTEGAKAIASGLHLPYRCIFLRKNRNWR